MEAVTKGSLGLSRLMTTKSILSRLLRTTLEKVSMASIVNVAFTPAVSGLNVETRWVWAA
jgi:hypothetical protein